MAELDKAKGASRPGFTNSPFSSNATAPPEFAPLIAGLQKVQKLSPQLKSTVESADQEYEKQIDPSNAVPSAPVYAARLHGLLKTLSGAETAVSECVSARDSLIEGLEKMLQEHKSARDTDQKSRAQILARKEEIEEKKQQVELAIMRALGPTDGNGAPTNGEDGVPAQEPGRPEMEALTPPAMEEFTPPAMEQLTPPAPEAESLSPIGYTGEPEDTDSKMDSSHALPISTNGSKKRRRVDDSGDFPDLEGDDGIDAEVTEMLKEDGT